MSTVSDAAGGGGRGAGGPAARACAARLARVSRAAWFGWAGVALGVIAFYIALPPMLVRTLVPSLVLALGRRRRSASSRCAAGEKRVGWGAVVACVAGVARRLRRGQLGRRQPRARRRLVGAARGDAALRDAADVRRARRRDVRARGRRQHRPRGHDADRRVLRRLGRRRHRRAGSAASSIGDRRRRA